MTQLRTEIKNANRFFLYRNQLAVLRRDYWLANPLWREKFEWWMI